MGTVAQRLQTTRFIPGQPGVQCLPAYPPFLGHLGDRPALADDCEDCLVSLFRHAQFPHVRECQESAETAVNHQPNSCQGSAESRLSGISRIYTPGLAGERVCGFTT
jgi:hypothetical protein